MNLSDLELGNSSSVEQMMDQPKLGKPVVGFDVPLVLLNYHFSLKWPRTDVVVPVHQLRRSHRVTVNFCGPSLLLFLIGRA